MGVNRRFQLRWIANSALICAFASSVLLLIMPAFLGRKLGHDYYKAYYIMKDLDASVVMLIVTPVLVYVLCASLLVVFFKLFISHKIAGPLFRFEKCAALIGSGDFDFSTRLRSGDQLNGLARAFGELADSLGRPFRSGGERLRNIESLLEALEDGAGAGDDGTDLRRLSKIEEELAGLARDFEPQAPKALQGSS